MVVSCAHRPLLAVLALLTGCDGGAGPTDGSGALEVWAHAGQEAERATLDAQVERFRALHPGVPVRLTFVPEGSYDAQVQAAAVAGELPDLLELDGPFVAAYAWRGHLRPLDGLLPRDVRDDLLSTLVEQGTYHDRLWAVGIFDSGLGLWADRQALDRAGVRVPTLEEPWTDEAFDDVLAGLSRHDADGQVLDLGLEHPGEWFTYAFSPLIQSAGGDLVDREGDGRAAGTLDGPDAVGALRAVQRWIRDGRVDPDLDGAAFVDGRVPLAFGGHWNHARYREHLGDDLLLLPLPDFGHGVRTGQGSWAWAVSARCRDPRAAATLLAFLLRADEVLAMTGANGAVPGTRTAVDRSPRYGPDGPLRLFVEQLVGGHAVPRPRTPAYPVITGEFQEAFERVRAGVDVQTALTRAARAIDAEIEDNHGYPWVVSVPGATDADAADAGGGDR